MLRKNYVGIVSIPFIVLDNLGMEMSEDDLCLLLGIFPMNVFISGTP
jgi:hypothetical protein